MTARPDVPDTPDRTDALARVLLWDPLDPDWQHYDRDEDTHGVIADARALLATDDPAAVAALAATLAERHPDALLTALTNAGVLRADWGWDDEGIWRGDEATARNRPGLTVVRYSTVWREVAP